ncbi:hypothetical protein FKP32DRAFT_1600355 [Trametes sanguinea]|nr:hypothetical protein FKP32DRAFT_1600355 [Trametes sanguinea]
MTIDNATHTCRGKSNQACDCSQFKRSKDRKKCKCGHSHNRHIPIPPQPKSTVDEVLRQLTSSLSSQVSDERARAEMLEGYRPLPGRREKAEGLSSQAPVVSMSQPSRTLPPARAVASGRHPSRKSKASGRAPSGQASDTVRIGSILLHPGGVWKDRDGTLIPREVKKPTPHECEQLGRFGLYFSQTINNEPLAFNKKWSQGAIDDYLRSLAPQAFEYLDSKHGERQGPRPKDFHWYLLGAERSKLYVLNRPVITGGDLNEVKGSSGRGVQGYAIRVVFRHEVPVHTYKSWAREIQGSDDGDDDLSGSDSIMSASEYDLTQQRTNGGARAEDSCDHGNESCGDDCREPLFIESDSGDEQDSESGDDRMSMRRGTQRTRARLRKASGSTVTAVPSVEHGRSKGKQKAIEITSGSESESPRSPSTDSEMDHLGDAKGLSRPGPITRSQAAQRRLLKRSRSSSPGSGSGLSDGNDSSVATSARRPSKRVKSPRDEETANGPSGGSGHGGIIARGSNESDSDDDFNSDFLTTYLWPDDGDMQHSTDQPFSPPTNPELDQHWQDIHGQAEVSEVLTSDLGIAVPGSSSSAAMITSTPTAGPSRRPSYRTSPPWGKQYLDSGAKGLCSPGKPKQNPWASAA